MLQSLARQPATRPSPLAVSIARSQQEVQEAQRLRYKVFVEEMGACLKGATDGLDGDMFDAHCEHLLVRDTVSGQVVGTYRILSPSAARRIGGYYADEEFDLTRLNHLRGQIVEIGRSCVHMNYRSGSTIALLWSGIFHYMQTHGYQYIIGCASVGMADGGLNAVAIYRRLAANSLSPVEYRAFPRCELPLDAYTEATVKSRLPPLIRGYLKVGAYVCSAPAWDPDFNTADLLMMLPMARIDPRYPRHFLRDTI
jgi:putative hemolysin